MAAESINGDRIFIIIGFLTMIAQNYFKARTDREARIQTREDRRLEIEEARSQREQKALEIKCEMERTRVEVGAHATRIAAEVINATDRATEAGKEAAAQAREAYKEANHVNLKIEKMGELIHETQKGQEKQ